MGQADCRRLCACRVLARRTSARSAWGRPGRHRCLDAGSLSSKTVSRATVAEDVSALAWFADGQRLIYRSARQGGLVRVQLGKLEVERLAPILTPGSPFGIAVSRSGKWMIFNETVVGASPLGIWRMPLDPTGPRELVAGGRFRLTYPSLSPDDCWLAYISDETGRPEAFVRPLAGGVGVQVSTAGADYVRWSRRGDELFFSNGTMILAAGVSTTPTVRVGAPAILLRGFPVTGVALECSVSPDAKRFVFMESVQAAMTGSLDVTLNWRAASADPVAPPK